MTKQIAKIEPTANVALMLEKIIEKGITTESVSALESLVNLYEKMQSKQAEVDFNAAFAKLQSEIPRVAATKPVPNRDGTIRYRYAPYEEILEQVQPHLSANGFSISFDSCIDSSTPQRVTATCILRHTSGAFKTNRFSVRLGSGPPGSTETQADGAAKTYAKRGALADALNIVVDHDDDARMTGKTIDPVEACKLATRVHDTKSDEIAFLKYAGVTPSGAQVAMGDYEKIPEDRLESLEEILRRKEGKLI